MTNLSGLPPLGLKQPRADDNPAYLAAVRQMPCIICEEWACRSLARQPRTIRSMTGTASASGRTLPPSRSAMDIIKAAGTTARSPSTSHPKHGAKPMALTTNSRRASRIACGTCWSKPHDPIPPRRA